jgi:exodeoxyribonuclease VII small subunit
MEKKEESYSKAIEKLQKIVAEMEDGNLDVDVLSDKVKEATRLIALCKDKLFKVNEEVQQSFQQVGK